MSALRELIQALASRRESFNGLYNVPQVWVEPDTADVSEKAAVNPFEFYLHRLTEIVNSDPQSLVHGSVGGEWSRNAIIYNLFPRLSAAFDHDDDGQLAPGLNVTGWRETGTLLKCIALLPYIRNLGFNTVHLLPITTIGQDGKKGSLGSPYAIRNPYELDDNLNEPILGLHINTIFAAFVEAAHLLGLRVILEFVLRTGSKDSDWIKDHPDWFYWIQADVPDRGLTRATARLNAYGSPIFSSDTIAVIKAKVQSFDFQDLPVPSAQYRGLFTQPPRPDQVYMDNGRYFGTLDDGTKVRVPGAFADWPVDDNQPPWTDVTYLRMYTHPDFNYMAYNTLRMYDSKFAAPQYINEPLWESVAGVIPHYQRTFNIDGVMIDMGHALPTALKERIVWLAREINPDFAFWDENFSITDHSRKEGYNAVMGWWVLASHEADGIRNVVGQLSHNPFPISAFGAPENHNTQRAHARPGGRSYAHYALSLAVTLPVMPFVLTGFELGETIPVNTGIGFSNEQLTHFPTEKLALFSPVALDWCRPVNMLKSVRYALSLRKKYEAIFNATNPESFILGYSDNPRILVYSRVVEDKQISIIANTDQLYEQRGRIVINATSHRVPGLWGTSEVGMDLYGETIANVSLVPGYVLILDTTVLREC